MDKRQNKQTYMQGIEKLFSRELLTVICIMALLAIVGSAVFAISSSRNSMKNYLNSYQKEIDGYIAGIKGETAVFALSMETGRLTDYDDEISIAETIVKSDSHIAAAYYCHSNEALSYYNSTDGIWVPNEGTVFTDRSWYVGAMEDGVYISEPYIDEVSGQFCVTVSEEVSVDGETVGVVGIDFLLGDITDLVSGSDVGNGYLMLASGEGVIMVHPNSAFNLTEDNSTSMSEAAGGAYKALYEHTGKIHNFIDYAGGPKTAISYKSDVSGWILVMVKPVISVYSGVIILILLIVALSTGAVILFRLYNRKRCGMWFAPIEKVSGMVPMLADGNLSLHFSDDNDISEISALSDSLNKTVEQLNYYIRDITSVVTGIAEYDLSVASAAEYHGDFLNIKDGLNTILDKLNDTFQKIGEKADTMVSYSGQIQKSSELVAVGTSEQSLAVSNLNDNMRELDAQIKSIMDNTQIAIDSVELTNKKLEEGGSKMRELELAMEKIEETTDNIDNIMKTINEIAQQTNLLSLNASIEAARAGDAGRGFAVVATEINSLAQQCSEASDSIRELVETSKETVAKGTELTKIASGSLKEGIDISKQSSQKVSEIQKYVGKQKDAIESIDSLTGEIVKVVESNAAAAQENAASGSDLTSCADELKSFVAKFRLR
ncbi:MAG: methyl-accepting chemotaxis protein [Butyrivibrio sp.]|nr:methyl-accepting chemotaxis protein [Butyrivibrio sp.]